MGLTNWVNYFCGSTLFGGAIYIVGDYINSIALKSVGVGAIIAGPIGGLLRNNSNKNIEKSLTDYFTRNPKELNQYIPIAREALENQIKSHYSKIERAKKQKESLEKTIKEINA